MTSKRPQTTGVNKTRTQGANMSRRLRPLATLALVALIGLISAGCSNAPSNTGTASSSGTVIGSGTGRNNKATDRDKAVKFAACMRENGVSDFPDPDASGSLTIDGIANGSSLDTNSAAFKQAISACKDLEPPGFTGGTRSPGQQKAALQFAACIRDNGVRDFPDPSNGDPLVDTNRILSAARNGGMSILNAAMQKCRDLAANAGVSGGQ